MISLRLAAPLAACLTVGIVGCGSDSGRPAHRPISVIYVAGDSAGPWAERTEGLADGVKLAIAERGGIVGERAVSVVVAPIVQRDGNQLSAAVGAGRVLRDSRAIAVLGALSAPETALAAPQFNSGELTFLQYGSGMRGLLAPEQRGEPGRYQPSGRSLALRGVPSDDAIVAAIRTIPGARELPVAIRDSAYREAQRADDVAIAQRARSARAKALKDGKTGKDAPPTTPGDAESLFTGNPSDAARVAGRLRVAAKQRSAAANPGTGAQIVVIDAAQPDVNEQARRAAGSSRGTLVLVDTADRRISAAAVAGHAGPVYRVRRVLDDVKTPQAIRIRTLEQQRFGRDRGDAVVAGYRAARRILALAAAQPEKTIDRNTYAQQLVADAPTNADLPVRMSEVMLGQVIVERLSGRRWTVLRER